ncbi:MAG TPA: hypothetical protein PLC47_05300, partial [Bacteroidales bacterium]|nr:hypothetical protein [Bacteroidales bacterium]
MKFDNPKSVMIRQLFTFTLLVTIFILNVPVDAQELSQSYESLMQSGNAKFESGDFISAKTYFEMALQKKKDDAAAQQKLTQTVEKIKNQMEKQEMFYLRLDLGDRLLAENKLNEAKKAYEQALEIFPEDKYTQTQLSSINKTLEEEAQKLADYEQAITLGKSLLEQTKYEEAILKFDQASALYPAQQEPAKLKSDATKLLEQKKINESKATALTAEAQNFILRKNFEEAITKLQEALTLLPEDENLNQLLANTQAQADQYQMFSKALETADQLYGSKSFEQARTKYAEALAIQPGDAYAEDMIRRIDETLQSDDYLAQQEYNNAMAEAGNFESQSEWYKAKTSYEKALGIKPADEVAQTKIAEMETRILDANYQQIMETAAALLDQDELRQARDKYVEAFNLKPSEPEPQQKIQQIDLLIASAEAAAEQENEYNRLIALAADAYANNQLAQALDYYQQAASLKPEQENISAKIGEINALLNEKEALQQRENNYNNLITTADQAFEANQFEQALTAYKDASALFDDRTYPLEQISLINEKMAAKAASEALEQKYLTLIAQGDEALSNRLASEAKTAFEEALSLKPAEEYPKNQLQKVESLLKEIAENLAFEEAFTNNIRTADSLFALAEWENARIAYQKAEKMKTNDHIVSQLAAIDLKLEEIATAEAFEARITAMQITADEAFEAGQWQQAIAQYDEILKLEANNEHALNRKASAMAELEAIAAEREQRFNEAILAGDELMEEKAFADALIQYKLAKGIQPDNELADNKIKSAEGLLEAEMMKLRTAYNKLVREGDQHYKAKTYDKAIEQYNKADQLKTGDPYPAEMIASIARQMQENKLVELNLNPIVISSGNAKRFSFEPVNIAERRSNYILVKARNTGTKGFPL